MTITRRSLLAGLAWALTFWGLSEWWLDLSTREYWTVLSISVIADIVNQIVNQIVRGPDQ
jgi:hypothetical protein